MNNQPRQKLRELIVEYGRSLCDDPRRCQALLKDYCGQYKREIFALISAQKNRVADDLLKAPANIPESIIIGRLKKRLEDDLGLAADVAQWAVESWAQALDVTGSVIDKKEIDSTLNASSGRTIRSNSEFATSLPKIQPKATQRTDQEFILLADQLKGKYGGWSNETIVKILIDNGCPEQMAKALTGFTKSVKPQTALKRLNPAPQFDTLPQQDFLLLANQLKPKYGGWSNETIVKILIDNGCPEQTAKVLAGITPQLDTRKPQISSAKLTIPTETESSLSEKINKLIKRLFI